jgi:hypothetical protein
MTVDLHSDLVDLRDLIESREDDDKAEALARAVELQLGRSLSELADDDPTLNRDDHFEQYARDLAEDCGMIPDDLSWPARCIDWERAARELQADYCEVTYLGRSWWIRCV